MKKNSNWNYIAFVTGILCAVNIIFIWYFPYKPFGWVGLVAIVSYLIVLRYNPDLWYRRTAKLFIGVIVFLNTWQITGTILIPGFGELSLTPSDPKVATVILGLLAFWCFYLDFRVRYGKGKQSSKEQQQNSIDIKHSKIRCLNQTRKRSRKNFNKWDKSGEAFDPLKGNQSKSRRPKSLIPESHLP